MFIFGNKVLTSRSPRKQGKFLHEVVERYTYGRADQHGRAVPSRGDGLGPLDFGHPNPCSSRVSWSRLPRTLSSFEYLQGWRLHSLAGQSVPAFDHPHSKKGF